MDVLPAPAWSALLEGLAFPEGPCARGGLIACVDARRGNLHLLEDGRSVRLAVGSRPNGAAFDGDALLVVDASDCTLLRVRLDAVGSADPVEPVLDHGLAGPNTSSSTPTASR